MTANIIFSAQGADDLERKRRAAAETADPVQFLLLKLDEATLEPAIDALLRYAPDMSAGAIIDAIVSTTLNLAFNLVAVTASGLSTPPEHASAICKGFANLIVSGIAETMEMRTDHLRKTLERRGREEALKKAEPAGNG